MMSVPIVSIIMNILFVLLGSYVLTDLGGFRYVKRKISQAKGVKKSSENTIYYQTKVNIYDNMPNETGKIIFLGDSITNFCEWYELFGKVNIKNRGIDGDIISNLSNRIEGIIASKPKKIFLTIGINDLVDKGVDEILAGYEKLVHQIVQKTPETQLYLQSILPTKDRRESANRDIIKINERIRKIAEKYTINYINLFDLFKTGANDLNEDYSFDGLHLNGKGYLVWKDAILKFVED